MSERKRRATPRIRPANYRDLPSTLDVQQAANVLRISVERVRKYTDDPADPQQRADPGRLHRLRYTRDFIYDVREVRRFQQFMTTSPAPPSEKTV